MDQGIDILLKIWQTATQQETNQFNALIRQDIARTNLLTTQLNHEHQIKMNELQERFKVQKKWFDAESRRSLLHEQALVTAHQEKMRQSGEYYGIGNYLIERLRNQPAPYIIISTNALNTLNPLKNEGLTNAPLSRVTNTLRQLNGIYESQRLMTISDTNEYFTSENDIASFYHRELNCPCVIVYANFTADALVVSAYTAGMLDEQREYTSIQNGTIDLRPRRQVLYSISYGDIYEMIQRAKNDNKPFEWQIRLSEFTNDLVTLWVQRYLDEYFKYAPLSIYESQTLTFINSKRDILKERFSHLIDDIEKKVKAISELQKSYSPSSELVFMPFRKFQSSYIIRPNFKDYLFTVATEAERFSNELLPIVNQDGKYGYINIDTELVLPFEFDYASSVVGSIARVRLGEELGIINIDGTMVIEFDDYDELFEPNLEISAILFIKGDVGGMYDFDGDLFLSKKFTGDVTKEFVQFATMMF